MGEANDSQNGEDGYGLVAHKAGGKREECPEVQRLAAQGVY